MGMYNHAWAQTLLGLTNLLEDVSPIGGLAAHTPEHQEEVVSSQEALAEEGIKISHLEHMVSGLERICDCSFRG